MAANPEDIRLSDACALGEESGETDASRADTVDR
jgi:hypothetical protein